MNKIINFESGLKLVVENIKSTRSLSIGIFVGVGCLYESKDNNGISHFIEHMLFKGTQSRSAFDIVNELESIGVNVNAYTSKNATAYYTSGLSEFGEKCMELLSDMYFNSTFDEENLTKEKGVVLEEIKMSEDDFEDLCLENLSVAHYGKTKAIAYPILGSAKNVKKFSKQDIKAFMDKNYTPQNTVISMAGDITIEKAKALVEKYFEINMIGKVAVKPKLYTNKPQARYIEKIKSDSQQAHIAISFPAYGLKRKRSVLNGVFCSMLAGNMSSRLFQKIREELGLVYTIYASPVAYVDDGYLFIYFATDSSQVPLAVKEIKKCLNTVIESGFTAEELQRTIIQSKTSILLAMESSMSVMRVNARSIILLGNKYSVKKQIKELENVTVADVNMMARYALNFGKASVCYVGKKPDYNAYKLFKDGE